MVNDIVADPSKLSSFKVKLYPTPEQEARIKEIASLYRYVYNFALAQFIYNRYGITEEEFNAYRAKGMSFRKILATLKRSDNPDISLIDMCKIFSKYRNSNEWLKSIPVNTGRFAIRNMYDGYRKYNRHHVRKSPKFKKRDDTRYGFTYRGEKCKIIEDDKSLEYVKVEGMNTPILIKHGRFPKGEIRKYQCTINYDGYEYYLTFRTQCYKPFYEPAKEGPIGIDVGMRTLATLSDGTTYNFPDMRKLEKRMRRAQSKVAKDTYRRYLQSKQAKTKLENIPRSKRMQKRYKNYRRICKKYWDTRRTFIHTMTREIVNRRPSCIVCEDLKVQKMIDDKLLYKGGQMYSFMFGEIRSQLEYKCKQDHIDFIKAAHNYPSSQICSRCGNIHNIGRTETYICPVCGLEINRDLNAALNLRSLATS